MKNKLIAFNLTTHNTTLKEQSTQTGRENREMFLALKALSEKKSRENIKDYIKEAIHVQRSQAKELSIFCEDNGFDLAVEILEDTENLQKRGYFDEENPPVHLACKECERVATCATWCQLSAKERLIGCVGFSRMVKHESGR